MPDSPHTAPVQDDDAEWLLRIIEPGTEIGQAISEGGAARIRRIASRLSPTPDTGLIEALRRVTDAAENLAGELRDPGTEALAAIYCARAALANASPAQPDRLSDDGEVTRIAAKLVEQWQEHRGEFFSRDVVGIVEDFAEWMTTSRPNQATKGDGL